MKYLAIFITLFGGVLLFASISIAQDSNQGSLGEVVKGNTAIVFEPANDSDLKGLTNHLEAWQQFANDHPGIAGEVARHPHLVSSTDWVSKHSSLNNSLPSIPRYAKAITYDPGDYFPPAHSPQVAETDSRLEICPHDEVVRKFLQNPPAHYHLGFAQEMIGDTTAEVGEYQRAEALGLRNWKLLLDLWMVHFENGTLDAGMGGFPRSGTFRITFQSRSRLLARVEC